MIVQREAEVLAEKSVPVPLYPPKIPNRLDLNGARFFFTLYSMRRYSLVVLWDPFCPFTFFVASLTELLLPESNQHAILGLRLASQLSA